MATYKNLPGVNLELLDGQLRVNNTSDARRVLIIGRSETGPSNRLYTVYDTNKAASAFGASTPLIRKMSEALLGGATQVQLYRIGGKPAKLNNIFGLRFNKSFLSFIYTLNRLIDILLRFPQRNR